MDLLFKNFLATYSLPTVAIAIILGVLNFFCDKFFYDKINSTARNYLTFLFAIIFYFIYETIFITKSFSLSIETVYAGILSGSLSTVFSCALNKITSGNSVSSAVKLLIEGILDGLISKQAMHATVSSLEKLFASEFEYSTLKEQIINIIAEGVIRPLSDDEAEQLAILLIHSIKALDAEKLKNLNK